MSKTAKIILIALLVPFVLYFACNLLFGVSFNRMFGTVNEKFEYSFDEQYMYTQLSSPKKTLCTIVIMKNDDSGKEISYTLPYFNNRTIKEIAWGLCTNDLFVDSSDTGLTVYRQDGDVWKPFYITSKTNADGTKTHYLCEQGKKHAQIPDGTIPESIKEKMNDFNSKFGKTLTVTVSEEECVDAAYLQKVLDKEIVEDVAYFDLMDEVELSKLIQYMADNNYSIVPGQYEFNQAWRFEDGYFVLPNNEKKTVFVFQRN